MSRAGLKRVGRSDVNFFDPLEKDTHFRLPVVPIVRRGRMGVQAQSDLFSCVDDLARIIDTYNGVKKPILDSHRQLLRTFSSSIEHTDRENC